MRCPTCNRQTLYITAEGCPQCAHKRTRIACERETTPQTGVGSSGNLYAQRASTLALRAKCAKYMKSRKWSTLRMSKHLNMRHDYFKQWWEGECTAHGQLTMNKRINDGFNARKGEMVCT